MSEFTSLMMKISDEIEASELETMKNSCRDYGIRASRLQEINEANDLFDELKKLTLLGPDKKEILVELLVKAGRYDLKNTVLESGVPSISTDSSHATVRGSSLAPGAPIVNAMLTNTHLTDISEAVGKDWKLLGRKLGISSNILDNINVDQQLVEQKAFQTMSRWKKKNANNATAQTLADALIAINRKDVAETLAKVCQKDGIHIHINEENGGLSQNSRTGSGGLESMRADLEPGLPL